MGGPGLAPIVAPSLDGLARAVGVLRAGGLVGLPTETVYGLAAAAADSQAVARVFAAKGRPSFNPLIVHVQDRAEAERYAVFDDRARRLVEVFWPGPLTLVLPKRPGAPVADLALAGLETIAVRAPAHASARALLVAFGSALVAPSANPSGRLSPTRAIDVARELGRAVDLVIDGGACAFGLESSVVGLVSATAPVLLRPGALARADIEAVLGAPLAEPGAMAAGSPGLLAQHYAPARARLRLDAVEAEPGEAYLGFGPGTYATLNLSPAGDVVEAASRLFPALRALDAAGFRQIAVAPIPAAGLGEAIRDRLARAAAGSVTNS